MAEISLCMIVRNEESVIGRCLSCAEKFADEIVIADTGSCDGTKRVCERYTGNIFDFEWCDDFAAARNFAFSKATKEYVMWLDADDVVSDENIGKLLELKASLDGDPIDTVMCKYVMSREENGAPAFSFYRERILRRETQPQWTGFVHECIVPRGKVVYTDIEIDHKKIAPGDAWRNLRIYQKKLSEGTMLDDRNKLYYGRELKDHRLYEEAACVLSDCLKTCPPSVGVEACEALSDCLSALGRRDEAAAALCRSFAYGAPRAETVCRLAALYRNTDDRQAAFWYMAALNCEGGAAGVFREPDCMDLIPYIELSCCYYRLGDKARAVKYHELAKSIRPSHPSVLFNERFFGGEE